MNRCHIRTQLLLLLTLLTGSIAAVHSTVAQDEATPPVASVAPPCFDGRLRIRDLEGADESLAAGVEAAKQQALAWEEDARLVILHLGCPLLDIGYQWDGTFFSEAAQAFWLSGTDEIEAADNDPNTIKTLVTDGLSFTQLYNSLQRAGYSDDLVINVTNGVTITYNTKEEPFGPPIAPVNVIFYHVAIEQRGEIKDVWVSVEDGTIYRYES
jgi:hypothetical protein